MTQWLVETSNRDDASALLKYLDLTLAERYPDGSIIVNCPFPPDEDALSDYCEDNDLECRLS